MSKGFEHNILNFGSIYNLYLFSYTRIVDFTCSVTDREELVGVTHRRWWGLFYKKWGLIHFFH